jgi:hypothetical protein
VTSVAPYRSAVAVMNRSAGSGMELVEGGRGNAHLARQRPLTEPSVDEGPPPRLNRLYELNPPALVQYCRSPERDG